MKTVALMIAGLLAAGVAGAQGTSTAAKTSKATAEHKTAAKPAAKSEDWKAEVVSVDKEKKEITLKLESETAPKTVALSETAAKEVAQMKAGEQVTVTVQENEKGEKVAHHVKHATSSKVAATKPAEKKPVEKKTTEKKPASPATK
jgi:uncharacterized protein (DUF58 family)